jgi:hypothetical protein
MKPPWMVIVLGASLTVLPSAGTCAPRSAADQISGVYRRDHVIKVVTEDGLEDVTATDSLTLSLEGGGRLRFSLALWFDNGHTCAMQGVAHSVGRFFEYREPIEESSTAARECVLRIRPSADVITLEDVDRGCGWGAGYCGARGTIDSAVFSLASRRRFVPRPMPGVGRKVPRGAGVRPKMVR